ncbi:uroporphyrinogen-III synthase [Halobacillus seohaensis]|uniref:Uroporphyrinogen-III synthase n=1 Tax=Halobacillus seohaensis TaxID=447421 RepID=A0ABW2EMX8_9BACI
MAGLAGKKIGVAADRSAESISKLIQKHEGHPQIFSIQGKQMLNEQICIENIQYFLKNSFDWVILTTGIGAKTLSDAAYENDLYSSFIDKLNKTNVAIRGKKTLDWCKKHTVNVHRISEDGTMENLLAAFTADQQVEQKQVFLQAYNQDDAQLKEELEKVQCSVYLSKPYSYERPDHEVLSNLKKKIIEQSLDAVVFTSKTQVKNILSEQLDTKNIVQAFNEQVLAVAVGKVTANELERSGIVNVLQPENPKMGAMIVEIDRYYQSINA